MPSQVYPPSPLWVRLVGSQQLRLAGPPSTSLPRERAGSRRDLEKQPLYCSSLALAWKHCFNTLTWEPPSPWSWRTRRLNLQFWQHFSDLDSFHLPFIVLYFSWKEYFPLTILEHHTQSFCAIIVFEAIPFTYTVVTENVSLGNSHWHMAYFLFPIYFHASGYTHFNNDRKKHTTTLFCFVSLQIPLKSST